MMLSLRVRSCSVIALAFVFSGRIDAGQEDAWRRATTEELARIRFMAEGWSANYDSFKSYRCKVRLQQGKCGSVEMGRANGPDRDVVVATATLVVDGDRLCYVRKSDAKPKFDPVASTASLALGPVGILTDGVQALDVDFFAAGTTLRSEATWSNKGVDYTTWNEGGSRTSGVYANFGPYITKALSLDNEFQIHSPAPIHGTITTRVDRRYKGRIDSWFVDEERGFIPVETWAVRADGQVSRKTFVTNIQAWSGGRWFPTRCAVVYFNGDEENGNHTVREIVVSDLEVDIEPRPDEFRIPLAQGTLIQNEGAPASAFTTANAKSFGLEDLSRLEKIGTTLALERERAQAPPESNRALIWAIAGTGAALVIAGVVIFLRWRKT